VNTVALVVFTDGRDDLLERSTASRRGHLTGRITTRVIHDDTGDPEHRARLQRTFPGYVVLGANYRRGFGGAVRAAWKYLRECTTEPYIWHAEDDFTFTRHVYLDKLVSVLAANPQLAQLALRRQPWNPAEVEAGGVVELNPTAFEDRVTEEHHWLEHRSFFTTNPSLYPRALLELSWPDGDQSEGHFTRRCLEAGLTFGYWGSRESGEWVTHLGHERNGTGY